MKQLSKSKILAYRQCPKRLWLELHRPEIRDDSGSEFAFAIGNQVGEVARRVYDSAEKGRLRDPHVIGWEESFTATTQALEAGEGPLFEGALQIPGALALADVLVPDGTGWRMIEVKASSSVKDYQRDDVAVQSYIGRRAGVDLTRVCLAHVDTSFIYPGGERYEGLLVEVDLTVEANARADEVADWIAGAQETAAQATEPNVEVGPHCSDPFDCPFADHCWKGVDQPEYPLSSFYRLHWTTRERLETEGFKDVRDVPDERLGEVNRWIKRQTLVGEAFFDAAGAAAALALYTSTARFLDFETIGFAVPIWAGTRPYEQLPFQFSCHELGADGELKHHEHLDVEGSDPRAPFAAALVEACGAEGPVFVYNASFENRVMRELAREVPEFVGEIHAIIDRVVDLEPIARRHYYHPSQHGSWSLKAVLPAVCPDLDYGALEGVHHGGEAQQAYLEAVAPDTASERREEIRRQLLDYCKLDTLALVRIWEKFRGSDAGL